MNITTPSLSHELSVSPVQRGELSPLEIKAECRQLRTFIETTEAQEFPSALGYHKMQLIEDAEMRHYLLLEELERLDYIEMQEVMAMKVQMGVASYGSYF